MMIQEWPEQERPREKLLSFGAHQLSDAELLAIFLRTGVAGESVVDMARRLLRHFCGVRGLLSADQSTFCAEHGLGVAKFVQLQAVLELARRHLAETLRTGEVFSSSAVARDYVRAQLRDTHIERFALVLLDNQHHLLSFDIIAEGTVDQAAVYPRVVLEKVLARRASAVILCHNHPSGCTVPSDADLRLTRRLVEALALVDIRVLDHLIVADTQVISLAERGEL